MAGVTGTIRKQVVFRQRGGKTFVSAYPDMSNRVLTDKQLKINKRMKAANKYARDTIADEALRNEAQIRLDVPSTKLYTSLVREFFKNAKAEEEEQRSAAE